MAYLVYTLHIPMISILAGILVFMLPRDIYALYLYATENCSTCIVANFEANYFDSKLHFKL